MNPNNNVLDRFNLAGKVVLLTGGAGIYGRGLAADLAAAGATLIIASRDVNKLEVVASEENAKGGCVVAEGFDQGSETSIIDLLGRITDRFGRIDGLVNNAVARPMGGDVPFLESWEASMRINATGVVLMHQHFGEAMAKQGSGSIVNVGSIYGMVGPHLEFYEGTSMPTPRPDYYFHKSGMINLSRYYAGIFGSKGVRVNCLSPGGFFTGQPEPFVTRYNEQTYLNRMGDESDLGGAVIFLLSEAARYITGVNLPVDGGFTAK